jgi:hypothetical protein
MEHSCGNKVCLNKAPRPMELVPSALALDQANNIYVVGLRRDFTAQFPVALSTAKFNPMGGLALVGQLSPDSINLGNEFSAGIHVDAAGRVTAIGSINGPNRDYVLVQYDQPASVEAPSILAQPQDALVKLGERVVFSVTASKALRYQWQFNGHDIADATNTTLVLPAAGPAEEGYYAVLVMNNLYCVSSETVRLALDVPQPIIVEHALRDGQFLCTVVVTPGFYYRLEASQDLFAWRSLGMVEALRTGNQFLGHQHSADAALLSSGAAEVGNSGTDGANLITKRRSNLANWIGSLGSILLATSTSAGVHTAPATFPRRWRSTRTTCLWPTTKRRCSASFRDASMGRRCGSGISRATLG